MLHTHEHKYFTLRYASHIIYAQQIEVDCSNNKVQDTVGVTLKLALC